jgi:hypothetical protein
MFGVGEDNSKTNNDQGYTATEPVDDGMLGSPANDDNSTSQPTEPTTSSTDEIVPVPPPSNQHDSSEPSSRNSVPATDNLDDLLSIKQKALQQLKPLVGHLDQTPEERFRTNMMMIQASDDQSLIPAAYEAANDISDEKTQAQALLDVINEINYFHSQKVS